LARIVTVYGDARDEFRPVEMGYIRWLKISEALARKGHSVDMATAEPLANGGGPVVMGKNLRRVPLAGVRWSDYDVVKTLFDWGFQTLEAHGGADHPFLVSKLGSVVDATDREGIYFHGAYRDALFQTQRRISETSRYVTLLSEGARELWREIFGPRDNLLLVPGAADAELPPPGPDPYPHGPGARVLFAGNVYSREHQPEANDVLVDKLNRLGELLVARDCRLLMIGTGDLRRLDPRAVTFLGAVPHERAWDYMRFADVGVVVSAGPFMHNNESTKIYHYLRAGLPVVSESGFPNDDVVAESGLGFVVESGDLDAMAHAVEEAARRDWNRDAAVRYILARHTWDRRAEVYDRLFAAHFSGAHTP